MSKETEIANNAEDTRKHGRRASDNPDYKGDMSHKDGSLLRWLINGVTVGGVIGAIFFSGRASSTMDTALKVNDKQDLRIEQLYQQNNKLLLALTEQNIQQKESDRRFEEKFDDANDKLDRINDGVQKNRESIIILQNGSGKLSLKDKTKVISVAMR